MSQLHGRLPEYPIAQKFLEIGFEISTCANSVYQAFYPPPSQMPGYEATTALQPALHCEWHSTVNGTPL